MADRLTDHSALGVQLAVTAAAPMSVTDPTRGLEAVAALHDATHDDMWDQVRRNREGLDAVASICPRGSCSSGSDTQAWAGSVTRAMTWGCGSLAGYVESRMRSETVSREGNRL